MPDITMCEDDMCPSSKTCYRFTATPSEWRQSYFHGTPRETLGDERCEYYSPNDEARKRLASLKVVSCACCRCNTAIKPGQRWSADVRELETPMSMVIGPSTFEHESPDDCIGNLTELLDHYKGIKT